MLRLTSGLHIKRHFRLVRQIGEGGMGCVWLAWDEGVGAGAEGATLVALKFPRSPAHVGSERDARFVAEAEMTIVHENVVRILGKGRVNHEMPFLVMEFLDGHTLRKELQRVGKLSLGAACAVLHPVVSALAYAHGKRIVHCDIKPENIFLSVAEDGKVVVKLLDFGVAARVTTAHEDAEQRREDARSEKRAAPGTREYAAPEQSRGAAADCPADIWAVGVVLYECVTGERPFPAGRHEHEPSSGSDAGSHRLASDCGRERTSALGRIAQLPASVQSVLARALSLNPAERPALHEVLEALREHSNPGELPVIEPSDRPSVMAKPAAISTVSDPRNLHTRAHAPGRWRRTAPFGGAAVLVAAVLLVTWILALPPAKKDEEPPRILPEPRKCLMVTWNLDGLASTCLADPPCNVHVELDGDSRDFSCKFYGATPSCERVSSAGSLNATFDHAAIHAVPSKAQDRHTTRVTVIGKHGPLPVHEIEVRPGTRQTLIGQDEVTFTLQHGGVSPDECQMYIATLNVK